MQQLGCQNGLPMLLDVVPQTRDDQDSGFGDWAHGGAIVGCAAEKCPIQKGGVGQAGTRLGVGRLSLIGRFTSAAREASAASAHHIQRVYPARSFVT